jgi:hypothetical protein
VEDVFGIGKIVEKAVDPVMDLVKRLAGPAADELGLSFQDSVKVWRVKRQYRLFGKVSGYIKDAGFTPNPITLKLLLPAVECASLEEDDDLQSVWAALLANAANPEVGNKVQVAFITALKELTFREVKFLNAFFSAIFTEIGVKPPMSSLYPTGGYREDQVFQIYESVGLIQSIEDSPVSDLQHYSNYDLTTFWATLDVLIRNRILKEELHPKPIVIEGSGSGPVITSVPESIDIRTQRAYDLTAFGVAFIEACQPPKSTK